jgi:hypothetical protein
VVVGQADFTHNSGNQGGAVAANTLFRPTGVYSDGTKLFIADYSNNRVLIYNTIPVANNTSANIAIGQVDLTHGSANQGGAVAANTLSSPWSVYSNGTQLYISDMVNNRVLIYNTIPVANNTSANVVVGQADFTHNSVNQGGTVAANTIKYPVEVYTSGTKMYIAETNSRLLIYNTVPVANNTLANVVVGQNDFTSINGIISAVNAGALVAPSGSFVTSNGKLIVADQSNNRVLIYNSIPTSNNASADVVVGQSDFVQNSINQGGTVAANTLYHPTKVFSDGAKLFIADQANNRVLIYNSIPTSNNASADVVIGQADFVHNSMDQGLPTGANTLNLPFDVLSDGTKLFISDSGNSRVLIYNTVPTSNNPSADVVIGQIGFTQNSANKGDVATADTLNSPYSIFSDGTKLYIADYNNSRVLIYNTIPLSNNASADVVIGQADFNSCTANRGTPLFGCLSFDGLPAANTLSYPIGINISNGRFFVSDNSNVRVLIWNNVPTTSGVSADGVIGQPNFTTMENNYGGSVAANTLAAGPYGVYSDSNGNVYVSDISNNRLLIYSGSHSSTLTSSIYDAGTPYTWGPLTYTATTPANTAVSFEVSTDDGATWVPVTNYTTQTFGPSNTVAYRTTLSNTDGISTPTLTGVTISGGLVSSLTTGQASSIAKDLATVSGELTDTGGSNATARGFEYGESTSYGFTITEASGPYGTGAFTANLTDLNCSTTYHYRSFATNIVGTSYGNDATFDTIQCSSSGSTSSSRRTSLTTTPKPTTPLPAPICTLFQTLRQGSKGEEVKCLQTMLNTKQLSNLVVDGLFGPKTRAAVINFQLTNQLVGDGIVGPLTRGVLGR